MKCTIKGSGTDVMKFREYLKKEISNYTMLVTEEIPEAAVQGSRFCTAVFYIGVSFLDFGIADKFYNSEIHFIWKDKEYAKPRRASKGQFRTVEVEKPREVETVFSQDVALGEYEELEHWEMRNAGEL